MKDYRWITQDEARLHYIAEMMARLKETGYIPPYGWEWGFWPRWLLDSTIAHYLYKILLEKVRKLDLKLVNGVPENKALTDEEHSFIKENAAFLTDKAYAMIEDAGAFVAKKRTPIKK